MAKKNVKVEKAHELYKQGMKLKKIAEELEIPEGTVRRWKSTYKWSNDISIPEQSKEKSERSDKKANAQSNKSERSDNNSKYSNKQCINEDEGTDKALLNEELTPRMQMFCIYYIKTFNATQSYMKAYNCSYETATASSSRLLRNVKVKKEIERLKKIKKQQVLCDVDDLVELNMRIAFADIGDYLEFGREDKYIMTMHGPLMIKNNNGEKTPALEKANIVRLKESTEVDTQLITEVKQGKDGISIKLADKDKAMRFLERYFEINPMDNHKKEYDKRKLEIEMLKIEASMKDNANTDDEVKDNFLDALNASANEVWNGDEDKDTGITE